MANKRFLLQKIHILIYMATIVFFTITTLQAQEISINSSYVTKDRYIPGQLSLILIDGPVYYRSYNDSSWHKAVLNQSFKFGDALRTGNLGYAVLAWSTNNLTLVKPKSAMRFIIKPDKSPALTIQLYKATLMTISNNSKDMQIEAKNGVLQVENGETAIQSNDNHEIIYALKGDSKFRILGNADFTDIPESYYLEFNKVGKDLPIKFFDTQTVYHSYRRFQNIVNNFNKVCKKNSLEIPFTIDSVKINGKFLSNMPTDNNGFYIIDSGNDKIPPYIYLQFKITPYPRPQDRFELYINKDLIYAVREGREGYFEVKFKTPSIPDFFIAVHKIDGSKRKIRIFSTRFTVLNRNSKKQTAKRFCRQLRKAITRKDKNWLREHVSRNYQDWLGNTYFDFLNFTEDTLRKYRDIRYFIYPFRFEYKDNKIIINANYRLSALTNDWTYRYEDKGTDIFTIALENGKWRLCSKISGIFFQQMHIAPDLRFGLIKGRITDERTKEPIEGVRVRLRNTGFITYTDSMGEYRFYNVPPGKYDLLFDKNGYGQITATQITVKPAGEQF